MPLTMRFSFFLSIRMDFNTFDVFHTSVLNWPSVAGWAGLASFDLILVGLVSGAHGVPESLWAFRLHTRSQQLPSDSCPHNGKWYWETMPRAMRHVKNRWCLKWSKWFQCHFLFDFGEFLRYIVQFRKINTNVYCLPTVLAAPLGFKWLNPKLSKKGGLLSQYLGERPTLAVARTRAWGPRLFFLASAACWATITPLLPTVLAGS